MKREIIPCMQDHINTCVALAMKAAQVQQAYNREVFGDALHAAAMLGWQEKLETTVREQQAGENAFVLLDDGEPVAFGAYRISGVVGIIGICEGNSTETLERLLCYIQEDMRGKGITHAIVNWEDHPGSTAMRAALERAGFEKYIPHVRYFQALKEAQILPETELRVIPAEEAHVEDCVRIALSLWDGIHAGYARLIGDDIHDVVMANWQDAHRVNIANQQRRTTSLVAILDGKVVGFCGCHVENGVLGVIGYNGVDPQFRGRGIARYMYEAVFDSFRSQGIQHARVFTGGDDGHGPARRAYEKAGFDKKLLSATFYKTL